MPIPERPQSASLDPRFRVMRTDDGSRTLLEIETGDTFHSGCGAVAECLHVYLENSGVGERLRSRRPTSVLEVGFGTGMAFALTAAEAIRSGTSLRYVALEHRLLPPAVMEQVLRDRDSPTGTDPNQQNAVPALPALPALTEYAQVCRELCQGLGGLPVGARGSHDLELTGECRLRLHLGDAAQWQAAGESNFDAVYFDPFSPASSPRLWEVSVLRRMFAVLEPQGRLVSYCVSRLVRERLESVGFHVRRAPGPPGGKREVLIAERA